MFDIGLVIFGVVIGIAGTVFVAHRWPTQFDKWVGRAAAVVNTASGK